MWMLSASLAEGMDAARLSTRLTKIEDHQRSLQGSLEETQHAIELLQQEIGKLKADMDLRFNEIQEGLEKKSSSALKTQKKRKEPQKTKNTIEKEPEQNAAQQEVQEDTNSDHPLEKARALFSANNYEEAQATVESYIATAPAKSDLAVAHYWLGESLFAQKRYEEAALAFVTGYKADAQGRRTPETLLKLARALVAVKKQKEARTTLRKLLKDYPDATPEIREKAAELLKKIA
jgi:tol-pal system protein YbgF